MATGLKTWSQTASSNGSADDQINYVEGQNPSTINNSGRALMAVVAKWRDDNNGTLTTSNSTNAYTVSTNQSLGTLSDGDTLIVRVNAANTGAATLNSKSWKKGDGSEFSSGELKEDAIYHLAFHSGDDEWRTLGVQTAPAASAITYNPATSGLNATTVQAAIDELVDNLQPVGTIAYFGANTPPGTWLECDGSAVSRTTYADLFAEIGTTFGTGDGSTTFNLPDLRGEFIRGWDNSRGVDAIRTFGSAQSDEFKAHTHDVDEGRFQGGGSGTLASGDDYTNTVHDTNPTSEAGGDETRPRNIALLPMIKALKVAA